MTTKHPCQPTRFTENARYLAEFSTDVLVVCPKCQQCARLVPRPKPHDPSRGDNRLVCHHCGNAEGYGYPTAVLANLWLESPWKPLLYWLQTPCCGETLWAYNLEHLAFLERYVSAQHRGHDQLPWGLTSRLPKWMTRAKNRDEVLRCIARLKERAIDG